MEEVVEFRRMFGLPDYVIRVQVADLAPYEEWMMHQFLGSSGLSRADSRLTMRVIKSRR